MPASSSTVRRRAPKGIAWAAPVVDVGIAAPVAAASPGTYPADREGGAAIAADSTVPSVERPVEVAPLSA